MTVPANTRFRLLLGLLALLPLAGEAASLGQIRVLSGIGERLRARIEVQLAPADRIEAMEARPAAEVASGSIPELWATVHLTPEGVGSVLVRSDDPIHQTGLTLTLDLDSPAGHSQRSYAIALENKPPKARQPDDAPVDAAAPHGRQSSVSHTTEPVHPLRLPKGCCVVMPQPAAPVAPSTVPVAIPVSQAIAAQPLADPPPAAEPAAVKAQARPAVKRANPLLSSAAAASPAPAFQPSPWLDYEIERRWTTGEKAAVGFALLLLALSAGAVARYW